MPLDANFWSTILLVVGMLFVFNFFVVRPQKKKAAEQQATMSTMVPGTRVMTTAGVFGTVRHVGEKQIVIEIAPGLEMTLLKAAIANVARPEDDEFEYDDEEDAPDEEDASAEGEFPTEDDAPGSEPANSADDSDAPVLEPDGSGEETTDEASPRAAEPK